MPAKAGQESGETRMKNVTIYAFILVVLLVTSAVAAEKSTMMNLNLTGEIAQDRECGMNFGNRGGEIIIVNVQGLPKDPPAKDYYSVAFPRLPGKIQWYENGEKIKEEYFDGGYWLPEKIWAWKDNCSKTLYNVRIIKKGKMMSIYVSRMNR